MFVTACNYKKSFVFDTAVKIIGHFRGGSTGRQGGDRLPPRRLLAQKIETPGRLKIRFISSRMHQNSPFKLKNQTPPQMGKGTPPFITPPLGASILAPTAFNSTRAFGAWPRRLRRLCRRRLHTPTLATPPGAAPGSLALSGSYVGSNILPRA